MNMNSNQLRVFICHASEDKPAVRELYHRLRQDGFNPWLDDEDLLPGQQWRLEIPKAVRKSDVVIICLTRRAVSKSGYVQKEIKYALDAAYEQPEDKIFLIPVKLEECPVPEQLRSWQYVNLFEARGYERLKRALKTRITGFSSITSPPVESLFDVRATYFTVEKEFVADRFSRLIFDRCKHLVEKHARPIKLFIDSGTTLYPIFRYIGLYGLTSYKNDETWIREGQLSIVTNSIPGFRSLVESVSLDKMSPHAGTAVKAFQLPGNAQAAYWAVTGDETVDALRKLKKDDNIIITLTTGNLIRIAEGSPPYPVPLARGTKHPPIKQEAIRIADETYVVGPLGKIIANATVVAINSALNQRITLKNTTRMEYAELTVDIPTERIKLVSTARPPGEPLYKLTVHLRNRLAISESIDNEGFVHANLGTTCHLLFPYTHSSGTPNLDFPDPLSRVPEFMKFFMDL
jgi:hypothetical protein